MTELKSFGSPPPAVLMVTGAVMVLMEGQKGKIPKDRSAKSNLICCAHLALQVLAEGQDDDEQG